MYLSDKFIWAGPDRSTIDRPVAAPEFQRRFQWDGQRAELTVSGLGFYELYVNGKNVTRGKLSPYISNTGDIVYYDVYDVTPFLKNGENELLILLGNGMMNGYGGWVWDFHFGCQTPRLALAMELDGELAFEADERFFCRRTAIVEDELRLGEIYDARLENADEWRPAQPAPSPLGEKRVADIDPIVEKETLRPVKIWEEDGAYIYDFGKSLAGVETLRINGTPGQRVVMTFGELIEDGKFTTRNLTFNPRYDITRPYIQRDEYVCAGGYAEWTPRFTYHGFRYVKVEGIDASQATDGLVTFTVWHTDLEERGGFESGNEVLNKLFNMARNSTRTNFHHFPTDCPHREKNGWTGDAALSSEQTLITFSPARNYLEWLRNVVKAQREDGAFPGIVPTFGWGFEWGNGPGWDQIIVEPAWRLLEWQGDIRAAELVLPAAEKYVRYLETRRDENGLLAIGLGDWCDVVKPIRAPLAVTDSILSMSIAQRAAALARAAGKNDALFKTFAASMRGAIRENLVDGVTVSGDCQTSQAMALYYGVFDESEEQAAFEVLLSQIRREDDHLSCGVFGLRVLFELLADHGYADLAVKMIARTDPPSYGYWVNEGLSTLPEHIHPRIASLNHHFMGHIAGFFITRLGGIRPDRVEPRFADSVPDVHAWHDFPQGRVDVRYSRKGDAVELEITAPAPLPLILHDGWSADGQTRLVTSGGKYILRRN